jgi:hypothetical protein
MAKVRVLHLLKTVDLGGTESNLLNLVTEAPGERSEIHASRAT